MRFMESKLRKEDEKCSDIVSSALNHMFYNNTKEFERVLDLDRQVKGIDTIFKLKDKTYLCDEKAAIRYVNKKLKTFSLELFFVNRKNQMNVGWLLDDKKVNNSFLFVWIDKADNDILQSENDIKEMEIVLVCKEQIIAFLEKLGWNKETLFKKCQKIINNENEYLGDIFNDKCKFSYSKKLVEKPINILISRDDLKKISDFNIKFVVKNV